jgi:NAD(P)-dependent dehydrogenase (short-subunit alcohol dehydrogenase family)
MNDLALWLNNRAEAEPLYRRALHFSPLTNHLSLPTLAWACQPYHSSAPSGCLLWSARRIVSDVSKQKTALVTGANKGIGLEIVRQLLADGFRVFLTARSKGAGRKAAASLDGDVHFLQMNVSDDASIATAAKKYSERNDSLDVLINNAGIYSDKNVSILTISREQLVETFQTNTFGPIKVTQAFLPFLKRSEGAQIINISSGYGEIGGLSYQVPSYCLSKLTLNGVTIMLDQALRSEGIAVYVVCPGWVRTDMGGANAARSVEEGADTAVWLATNGSKTLSGKFFRDRKVIGW